MRSLILLGSAASLLAACNSAQDAEDVAQESIEAPVPELTPAPLATQAADGTAVALGTWDVSEAASGAQAVFNSEDGTELLAIRCDRLSGSVTMSFAADDGVPVSYRLDAGGEAARVDMIPAGGGLAAEIEPGLAIFHAFGETGQTVSLTSPEGNIVQYPTHPGISRVLYACS